MWERAEQVTSREKVLAGDAVQRGEPMLSWGMCASGTSPGQGVSVSLYPAAFLGYLLFNSPQRGVWGCASPPERQCQPPRTHRVWAETAQGQRLGLLEAKAAKDRSSLFLLLHWPSMVWEQRPQLLWAQSFPLGINMTHCLQHPSCLSDSPRNRGGSWLSQPTDLPGRAVSPCFMFLWYLSPLFWSSNGRNLNPISVKSLFLKPDVQDHWITLHRLALEPCFSV